MKAVEEPRRAITHIQKTAPAPPAEMAATTPTRFPIPTRVAVDKNNVCRPEIAPFCEDSFVCAVSFTISGNMRKGRKRVRRVK